MENTKTCAMCGEKLHGRQTKFCSKKCTKAYYLRERNKYSGCPQCGRKVPYYNFKFCSQECAMAWREGVKNEEIELAKRKSKPVKPLLSWEEMGKLMNETGLSYGELTARMDGYRK